VATDGVDDLAERAQRAGSAIRALADEMNAKASRHTYATSMVSLELDPDGLPARIEVRPQWRREIGAGDFAAAVTEACRGSAAARAADFDEAATAGQWLRRMTEVLAYLTGDGPAPAGVSRAAEPAKQATPRSLSAVVETLTSDGEIIAAAAANVGALPPVRSGTAGRGMLELSLDAAGTITCTADADWVAGRETAELNEALAAAVTELRAAATTESPVARLLAARADLAAGIEALMENDPRSAGG
jgi:hypothetical protein